MNQKKKRMDSSDFWGDEDEFPIPQKKSVNKPKPSFQNHDDSSTKEKKLFIQNDENKREEECQNSNDKKNEEEEESSNDSMDEEHENSKVICFLPPFKLSPEGNPHAYTNNFKNSDKNEGEACERIEEESKYDHNGLTNDEIIKNEDKNDLDTKEEPKNSVKQRQSVLKGRFLAKRISFLIFAIFKKIYFFFFCFLKSLDLTE